ncbi:MAG: hypothetical protein CL678_00480 [Bdellovibrionaceae bacterium]|nr:hypothetical protein [Pseudobdellovibrionaceae bacterium]
MEDPDRITAKALAEVFKTSALHQTALWTLTSELQRKSLVWQKSKVKAGKMIKLFVAELVRSFMAYGYAVWKVSRGGRLTVASPEICRVVRVKPGARWKVEAVNSPAFSARGWHCTTMVEPPSHILRPDANDWPAPSVLSWKHFLRVREIEENWIRRDTHNSFPSVFTTINLEHFGQRVSEDTRVVHTLPTQSQYRNAQDYGTSIFPDVDAGDDATATFEDVLKSRHDAVRRLEQHSTLERERIMQSRSAGLAWDPKTDVQSAAPIHEEHIVSDGKKAVETKVLLSAMDARLQYDRTRHAVLFALGVPPQAVGETVNSERTASSAAIYDVAIGLFLRTVKQYREVVEQVLEQATTLDDGDVIKYASGVSGIQLARVLPLVQTSKAIELLAESYDLPKSFFDKERVAAMQSSEFAGARNAGSGKGPQRQLESVAATPSQRGQNAM